MARTGISWDQIGLMEVDEKGQLFWKGKAVVMEQQFTLGKVERWLAGLAAASTVIAAAFPIALHFHWFGW